ncbi:glycosyltransferase family 32 protein [Commensalibacter papalotli (ex Servin-Garciduenas et al. 2014)]|uniref:Uncharacterized protein n=1 Tax=Commensalibacter papalotli (ex Servin-Garciduenas et al. 2014) TaxID=1208583 RepID=W7DTV0_9PROT|nr:glycosyltransferase [Commensalibacter papalotli (ex Servin-Garciduenas et al. 2014)]EUK17693.1 hypothetical protein COMX_09546 [Commensalibacter papalotli (ex Servin-Garciduenas et al. 2014)]
MFIQEEKEKAKYFKFSLHPQDELEQYLNPRFLSVINEEISIDALQPVNTNIPKKIVIFWHEKDLPDDVYASIEKIKRYNTEYYVELFHTESAGEFINSHYGQELYYLYERRCVHPSMKSDFFRICYLAKMGGIYIDVDINCFKSLEEIFKFYEFDCFLFYTKGKPCCIDNDFIACKANNPIISAVLDKIKENLTIKRSFSSVWECTGPGAVSMAILELLMQDILQDDQENRSLEGLRLAPHKFALRAYSHQELEYKKTTEGNWRYFRMPSQLYKL